MTAFLRTPIRTRAPLSELSNLATLIFFSLVFFNFLAHATQNIGLSSVRTLAYTFQTIELFYMQW